MSKTAEKNFEDDVELFLGELGWRNVYNECEGDPTEDNNRLAQADYDRARALKVDSLIGFVPMCAICRVMERLRASQRSPAA